MFSFHSKYFVYQELKRAPQKLSFCFKCPDTGTVRILGNILYASFGADCIIPQHHETTRSLLTDKNTKTSDGELKCIAVFYKNSLLFQLNATVKTESLLKRQGSIIRIILHDNPSLHAKDETFSKTAAQAKKYTDRFFRVIRKVLPILKSFSRGLFPIARKSLELQSSCYQMAKRLKTEQQLRSKYPGPSIPR